VRELVLYTLLSLDGVAEEPGNWMFEADEEVFANLGRVIETQDDVLLGRGTYDYWAGFWPSADIRPFADFINTTTKHVFTHGTPTESWSESVFVDQPPHGYVDDLKRQAGRDIGVHGSISLAGHLLAADVVDRLELVIVPTIAGGGRSCSSTTWTLDGSRWHA
jgi:dihydrofolate reductase